MKKATGPPSRNLDFQAINLDPKEEEMEKGQKSAIEEDKLQKFVEFTEKFVPDQESGNWTSHWTSYKDKSKFWKGKASIWKPHGPRILVPIWSL